VIQRNLYEFCAGFAKSDTDLSAALARSGTGQSSAARARARVDGRCDRRGAADGWFSRCGQLLSTRAEGAPNWRRTTPGESHRMKRRVIAPPPPPPPPPPPDRITQLQRIRKALAAEHLACVMTADQTGSFIIIRVCDLVLFESGQATVLWTPSSRSRPASLRRWTRSRGTSRSSVTPTTRQSVRAFPVNFELSVERAKAVAAVLKRGLTDSNRVDLEGKGPDVPIASNATPEGRARNRRVEIFIERSE